MNSGIPPALAPYLKECISTRSLTLITSVLNTPANWLVVRFLSQASPGQSQGAGNQPGNQQIIAAPSGQRIIFVSIWRSLDFWNELAKKCGVNINEKIVAKQIYYVDALSASSPSKDGIIKVEALTLKDLSSAISSTLQTISASQAESPSQTTVIIDGIDLLLACDPSITSTDIQQLLTETQSKVHSLVLTCAADTPLLHNTDASATPLEHEHGGLVRSLGHQADFVFQLRPLETGHSREVDGTVRVSKGGSWEGGGRDMEEGEWLFHVKVDGTARVWSRGEA